MAKTAGAKEFEGYAKIHGYDFDYILNKLSVVLGRKTRHNKNVDIDLGNYKNVSRVHAQITYNFSKDMWEIKALGKNGVRVDRKAVQQGNAPYPLKDNSEIRLGDVLFVFQIPNAAVIKPVPTDTIETPDDSKVYEKPTISYATLIGQALSNSTSKRLTLKEIYQYIMDNYPYFRTSEVGWKSSVRHNLSLNKFFYKVPQEECEGKRAMYGLNTEFEQDLLNGLTGRRANKKQPSTPKPGKKPKESPAEGGPSESPTMLQPSPVQGGAPAPSPGPKKRGRKRKNPEASPSDASTVASMPMMNPSDPAAAAYMTLGSSMMSSFATSPLMSPPSTPTTPTGGTAPQATLYHLMQQQQVQAQQLLAHQYSIPRGMMSMGIPLSSLQHYMMNPQQQQQLEAMLGQHNPMNMNMNMNMNMMTGMLSGLYGAPQGSAQALPQSTTSQPSEGEPPLKRPRIDEGEQ